MKLRARQTTQLLMEPAGLDPRKVRVRIDERLRSVLEMVSREHAGQRVLVVAHQAAERLEPVGHLARELPLQMLAALRGLEAQARVTPAAAGSRGR